MKQTFASNWCAYKVDSPSVSETETTQPVKKRSNQFSVQIEIGEGNSTSKGAKVHNRVFEELLLEAVDEGLSCLGASTKQAIYLHLERTFKISRENIPREIEEFTEAIEEIFGAGAKLLEIQIMKRLFEKIGHFKYFPQQEDIVFTEYIGALSQAFNGIS